MKLKYLKEKKRKEIKIMKINQSILYFLYPKKCMFCGELICLYESAEENKINKNIERDFICKYCSQYLPIREVIKEPSIAIFDYNDLIRDTILDMKYKNKKQYAKGFAIIMYEQFNKIKSLDYDIVINVPMYYKKRKKRGYDQAEELAKEFALLAGITFEGNNLIRTKNTIAQSKVSFEERKLNVKGIFKVLNQSNIKDKNIILVDDIYTSGNTINQCRIELIKAGAKSISYLVLAKVDDK